MSLGSGFPPALRQEWVRQRLRPGAVIKLRQRMDDGVVHEKRFIVLHVDEQTVTCVINSRVGPFILDRPALLRCQVQMRGEVHTFMDHDSFVDCSRTRAYPSADVVNDLVREPGWILGHITSDLRDEILGALKHAPTLPPAEVGRFCLSLEAADLE